MKYAEARSLRVGSILAMKANSPFGMYEGLGPGDKVILTKELEVHAYPKLRWFVVSFGYGRHLMNQHSGWLVRYTNLIER